MHPPCSKGLPCLTELSYFLSDIGRNWSRPLSRGSLRQSVPTTPRTSTIPSKRQHQSASSNSWVVIARVPTTFVGSFCLIGPSDEEKPGYDALSYTWESVVEGWKSRLSLDPRGDLQTRLRDGMTLELDLFSIDNLTSFLKAAFSANEKRAAPVDFSVWIDALCINQRDAQEKKTQMALMGDIYFKARGVLAWMGENLQNWHEFHWVCQVLGRRLAAFCGRDGSAILAPHMLTSPIFFGQGIFRHFSNSREIWKASGRASGASWGRDAGFNGFGRTRSRCWQTGSLCFAETTMTQFH